MSPITLHTLKPRSGSRKSRKRLGRGLASGHGAYSTRGIKGQRARQGGRKGLTQLGIKHFVSHLPKSRGFKSQSGGMQVVQLMDIAKLAEGILITPERLAKENLIGNAKGAVKLIGSVKLTHKITVKVNAISSGAREAIEKSGGSVELITNP